MSYSVDDPEFYLKDAEGNEHMFAICDYATAEEHRQAREKYFNQLIIHTCSNIRNSENS